MTAAAENPTEPEYRLCCDDVPEEPEELDVMEEPDEEPEEQEEWEEQTTAAKVTRKPEPVVIINHTTQPAKVPQKQSVRPTPAPVVNSEADPLTGFLSSLSPSCKAEAVKYSEIPDRDLKIPTGQSATAILTAFAKKHAKVPKGTRNATLFLYACTLRRCGYEEPMILVNLWQFSRAHCKPPHDRTNRDDVAELTSLASRVIRIVRPGFPREAVKPLYPVSSPSPAGNPAARPDKATKETPAALIKKADAIPQQAQAGKNPDGTPAPEIAEAARKIYESGGFPQYCIDIFRKVWLGDDHILMAILLTAANIRVLNAKDGIHLFVNGPTQSGKSDSVKKSLLFVPPSDRLTKTFSDMYLYHANKVGDLHEGMLVFSDDTVLSENVAALYRNMLTSWFTGVDRGSVTNQDARTLHIPARISLILTAVESMVRETDEGQDESRFLTLEVRRTTEQMKKIRDFVQEPHPDVGPDLDIIYAVWSLITPGVVALHKKIETEIPIREFKRYLTLAQSHALLCNRTTTTDADFLAIDQFLTYSKPMINSTTPGFLRNEMVIMQCLVDGKHKTAQEIQDSTGLTIQAVYKALRGKEGTFQNPKGGLMSKEPKLEYARESVPGINDMHTFWLRK